MPLLNNELLDDPLLFDLCDSFVSGQESYTRANRIAATAAAFLQNLDITRDGLVATRRGSMLVGAPSQLAAAAGHRIQGLAYYDIPGKQRLVAATAATLWKWDNAAWSDTIHTSGSAPYAATDADRQLQMVQGVDLLYIVDGANNLFSWDGGALGLLDLGNNVGGDNTKPPIGSILAWHTDRLFMSGNPLVRDMVAASNFLDGATWNAATQQVRVGAGDGDPVMALCPWIAFDLVVLKRHSMWDITADPTQDPAMWSITQVHNRIGCVSQRSVCQVGKDVWFLSDTGVRSVQRTIATTQNEITDAISYPIQDIVDRINWSAADKCAAVFWNNRYFLSVPLDSATEPNVCLVYNTLVKGWSGYWTGWSPLAFAISAFDGQYRMNFGQPNGSVSRWLDFVVLDSETQDTFRDEVMIDSVSKTSAEVPTSLVTRAMTFATSPQMAQRGYLASEWMNPKKGFNLEIEFFQSVAQADVRVVMDNEEPIAVSQPFDTQSPPLLLPFSLPAILPPAGVWRRAFDLMQYEPFRELQISLASAAGKLSLRAINASAFLNTMEVER